jgi:hypothetical protein
MALMPGRRRDDRYSYRSAEAGSSRVARRDGPMHAVTATAITAGLSRKIAIPAVDRMASVTAPKANLWMTPPPQFWTVNVGVGRYTTLRRW